MRFHVLGVGSIGGLLAHHLRQTLAPEHSVVLIHKTLGQAYNAQRKGSVITVERDGIQQQSSGHKSEVWRLKRLVGIDRWAEKYPRLTRAGIRRPRRPHEPYAEAEEDFSPSASIESLFVATKAGGVVSAIKELVPRLQTHSTIVLLNNGMGVYEELVSKVFRNPEARPHFVLAVNNNGAFLKDQMHVVHTGPGSIQFGIVPDPMGRNYEERLDDTLALPLDSISSRDDPHSERYISLRNTIAALASLEGVGASWSPISTVLHAMKRKLVVNAIVNPLTAIMNCRNGDVFQSDYARHVAQRVCREAGQAFAADLRAGLNTTRIAGHGQDGLPRWQGRLALLPAPLEPRALEEEVLRVAHNTADNLSSMLVDVRRGKATEIEYINGYLLRLGWTHNVRMHTTASLYNLVKMRHTIPIDNLLKH